MRSGDLLQLVRRYRLFFVPMAEAEPNAVIKHLVRLVREGVLYKHRLCGPRSYWSDSPFPLGPQALPLAYSVASYCLCRREEAARERLKTREARKRFPWVPRCPEVLCVEGEELQAVRTDLGGEPDHVVRKARRFFRRLRDVPEFRALCGAGRFAYVILTASEDKADKIEDSLGRNDWPFPFQLCAIPDLLELLTHARKA